MQLSIPKTLQILKICKKVIKKSIFGKQKYAPNNEMLYYVFLCSSYVILILFAACILLFSFSYKWNSSKSDTEHLKKFQDVKVLLIVMISQGSRPNMFTLLY